ncbi:hypothetical protein ACM66B_006992 [Microbotryomycetes sp. NB124-2]
MSTSRLLVVGLGNYTHPLTRHSVGQIALNGLVQCAAHDANSLDGRRSGRLKLDATHKAWTTTVALSHPQQKEKTLEIMFCQPKIPMNGNGVAVASCAKSFLGPPSIATSRRVVTLQDDLDLSPLTVKVRKGGSARGHKGVKSVVDCFKGNSDFWRVMIGIGRPESKSQVANYVLEPLGRQEVHEFEWDEDNGQPGNMLAQVWQHVLKVGWSDPAGSGGKA